MKNYLIAERYAKGLINSIPDDDQLEAAIEALRRLRDIYESSHDFRSVLANPAIDKEKRTKVLADVLDVEEFPKVVRRLADVLLRRGRISILPDVAEVFSMLADKRLNRVQATVTTAVELKNEQEARLSRALERYSGKKVRLRRQVDPDVLGGVVARIGSTVVDGSVRTRLERLRNALLSEE